MEKKTSNIIEQLSKPKLNRIAFLAFLPFTGVIGVHNFILKQYKKGAAHIFIIVLSYILCNIVILSRNDTTMVRILPGLVFSYIWAVVEGAKIVRFNNQRAYNQSMASSQVMNSDSRAANNHNSYPFLSLITAIIPLAFFFYCWNYSGGETSENGPGAVWMIFGWYFILIGLPLEFLSIKCAIEGLKTRFGWLSIISLLFRVVMYVAMVIIVSK